MKAFALEESWEVIRQVLPADLETIARQSGSFQRARKVGDALSLLRLLLTHASYRGVEGELPFAAAAQRIAVLAGDSGCGPVPDRIRLLELGGIDDTHALHASCRKQAMRTTGPLRCAA